MKYVTLEQSYHIYTHFEILQKVKRSTENWLNVG